MLSGKGSAEGAVGEGLGRDGQVLASGRSACSGEIECWATYQDRCSTTGEQL